jgi:hypothetical protein
MKCRLPQSILRVRRLCLKSARGKNASQKGATPGLHEAMCLSSHGPQLGGGRLLKPEAHFRVATTSAARCCELHIRAIKLSQLAIKKKKKERGGGYTASGKERRSSAAAVQWLDRKKKEGGGGGG